MSGTQSILGPGESYTNISCAQINSACTAGTFGSTSFNTTVGGIYAIDLLAIGNGSVHCAGCFVSGSALIDPYIRIDPSPSYA
jgi:hypothetical protein